MSYLGLALFAEGMTDHRFLRPLLRRVTEAACLLHARTQVEVSEVLELHSPRDLAGADRATRISAAARESRGAWHLLFVHTDGAGDPARARTERVDPAAAIIHGDEAFGNSRVVAVVPVRETEAWPLADCDAVRSAFGTTLTNETLGLPARPRDAESVLDPKAVLQEAYRRVLGRPRRSSRSASDFLDVLGERVSLSVIRGVPSFSSLEHELRAALDLLHVT